MGALLNYLHHRQLSFDEKDESYPGVIARDSGGFHLRTQLIDALNESFPDSRLCQFSLGSEPLWASVYSVFDPQDSIKELLNCVLRLVGQQNGGPMWTAAFQISRTLAGRAESVIPDSYSALEPDRFTMLPLTQSVSFC